MEYNYDSAIGKFKRIAVVRLGANSDLKLGIEAFCNENQITSGVILFAFGSIKDVRYCNAMRAPEVKAGYAYSDPPLIINGGMELIGLNGTISKNKEGIIETHIHFSMSDQYGNGHGGHLVEGTKVLITAEILIAELEDIEMTKKYHSDFDLYLSTPVQVNKTV